MRNPCEKGSRRERWFAHTSVSIAVLVINLQTPTLCSAQQGQISLSGQNALAAARERVARSFTNSAEKRAGNVGWKSWTLTLDRKDAPDPAGILRSEATWLNSIPIKQGDIFPVNRPDEGGIGIVSEIRENYIRTETYVSAVVVGGETALSTCYEVSEFGYDLINEKVFFYARQSRFRINNDRADQHEPSIGQPLRSQRTEARIFANGHPLEGIPTSRLDVERFRATLRGTRELNKAILSVVEEKKFLGRNLTRREERMLTGAHFLIRLDQLFESIENDLRASPDGNFAFVTSGTLEALGDLGLEIVKDLESSRRLRKSLDRLSRRGVFGALDGLPDLARAGARQLGKGELDNEAEKNYQDGIVAAAEGIAAAVAAAEKSRMLGRVAPSHLIWTSLSPAKNFIQLIEMIHEKKSTPEVVTQFLDMANGGIATLLGVTICEGDLGCVLAVRDLIKEAAEEGRALSADWFQSVVAELSGSRAEVLDQWAQLQRHNWDRGLKLVRISKQYGKEELIRLGFTEDMIACLDLAADQGQDPDTIVDEMCNGKIEICGVNSKEHEGDAEKDSCLPPIGCPYEAAECPFWWPRPPFVPVPVEEGPGEKGEPVSTNEGPDDHPPPPPAAVGGQMDPQQLAPIRSAGEAFLRRIAKHLAMDEKEVDQRIKASAGGGGVVPVWVRFSLERSHLAIDFISFQRYMAGRSDSPGVLVSE